MFLNGLLSKRLRITIHDGRIIEGDLMCTDNGCNIVINNCDEYLTQADLGKLLYRIHYHVYIMYIM